MIEQQYTFREEDINMKILYGTGIVNEKEQRSSIPY